MSTYLSSKEVLQESGISRATLNNYIALGILPSPEIRTPAGAENRTRRLGYYPADVLQTLAEVKDLKRRGLSLAQIAENMRGRAGRESTPDNPLEPLCPLPLPSLNLREPLIPAYLMNEHMEVLWCNDAFGRDLLGSLDPLYDLRQLPGQSRPRDLFRIFFRSPAFRMGFAWSALFSFHLGLVKNHFDLVTLTTTYGDLNSAEFAFLREALEMAVFLEPAPIVETLIDLPTTKGPPILYKIHAIFFQGGILVLYLPVGTPNQVLIGSLGQREQVMQDVMRNRLPMLTQLCVFVADVQDSVKISVELPPEEYFELINEFWGETDPVFQKYFGTRGKHVGDGLVYYFFPQPDTNYIVNALLCALEIKAKAREISRAWQMRKKWDREIYLNIGLNHGREWFGTFVSGNSVEFTALGDTINSAARLSDFARYGAIWITKNMLAELSIEERSQFRFGIRRHSTDRGELFVENSYSRIADLVNLQEERFSKFKDIANLAITEMTGSLLPHACSGERQTGSGA